MCRIDANFSNLSLNEKSDPYERFIQALDESGISGHLRSLLTEHFSDNWNHVFGSASDLEDTLNSVSQETSDQGKCAAILSSRRLAYKLDMQLLQKDPVVSRNFGVSGHGSELVVFAQDFAQTCFPDSPYALYSAVKNLGTPASLSSSFDWFVTALYGQEFCFSRSLFDDPALIAEGEFTRNDVLWGFFKSMSEHDNGNPNEQAGMHETQANKLISVASLQTQAGPPTLSAHKFLQGVRYLETWIASDAATGRLSSASEGAFHKLDFEWSSLYSPIRSISPSSSVPQEVLDATTSWLDKTKVTLWKTLYLHMDLTSADDHQVEQWASQLNSCFTSLSIRYPDVLTQSPEEQDATENEGLKLICSQLSAYKIDAWIQWSIQQDIESTLRNAGRARASRAFSGTESKKWWASEYAAIWKAKLEEKLNNLDFEAKLAVLSGTLHRLPNEAAAREYQAWWDGLFENLIRDPELPVALIPQWTIAAIDRLDKVLLFPYIDKSIGLLRGELSRGGKQEHHKQLEELLRPLSSLDPSKALRHRLILMRSSSVPFSDASVSRFNPMNSDKAIAWYLPLKEVAKNRFARIINSKRSLGQKEYEQVEVECYESLALELVEFCLSRLRLRKGEKPKDGKYDSSQVTERSPTWRQGYLKALLELGLDPNGKAHKAVYFTKQFDPDDSAREIAKECYRSVRREANKKHSAQDFRRGLIAAEWWLLISQRLELNLDVNDAEALKTRRSLLRNP